MKFYLDTENLENLKLDITEEESDSVSLAIQEFCFGMSSFLVDFMTKLDCDTTETVNNIKKACFSVMEKYLDIMIDDIILNKNDPEKNDELDAEINNVVAELKKLGVNEESIEALVDLIREKGSIDAATEALMELGTDHGIDWSQY